MVSSESTVQLIRVATLGEEGRPTRGIVRAAASGEHQRIRRGVYVKSSEWQAATDADRHRARMSAAVATHTSNPVVFSHQSAASIWGFPTIGRLPLGVHALIGNRRRTHAHDGVVWHRRPLDDSDVCNLGGFFVTTLIRTFVDLARISDFPSAVASLDYGTKQLLRLPHGGTIAGVPREILIERLMRDGPARGVRSARAALEFSDPLSGSPGESGSPVQMHRLRFPRPRLQIPVPRRDAAGVDIPDFEWDNSLREFGGKIKYTRATTPAGGVSKKSCGLRSAARTGFGRQRGSPWLDGSGAMRWIRGDWRASSWTRG